VWLTGLANPPGPKIATEEKRMGKNQGNGGSKHDRAADQDKQAAKDHYEELQRQQEQEQQKGEEE
jgi:hypothetical protein